MKSWRTLNQLITRCNQCPRLLEHCRGIGQEKRRAYRDDQYWAKPVPNFGDPSARLLIVGLAPAAHGANRTGRMFTGDRSGDWLFRALHKFGFASQAEAKGLNDGLELIDCAITSVCHCAPPGNRPAADEKLNCRPFLTSTFELLKPKVVLALGQIAWSAVFEFLKSTGEFDGARPKFSHGARYKLSEKRIIFASYHPSQQNTFTGRLTEAMLDDVMHHLREALTD